MQLFFKLLNTIVLQFLTTITLIIFSPPVTDCPFTAIR